MRPFAEPWTNRALAGEDVHYERQAIKSDGTSQWLSVNLRPHRDASGKVLGFEDAVKSALSGGKT